MRLRLKAALLPALTAAVLAAALELAATAAGAQNAGPFEILAGSWSGTGAVNTSDGLHERVRCIAKYVSQNSGHSVKIDLRCASDSYKVEFNGSIEQSGDGLSGNWFESTRRVGGKITGKVNGNQLNVRAEGDTFTALLSVKTQGTRQTFSMESPGAYVPQFSIALNRAVR
jgi:hypothetical protein